MNVLKLILTLLLLIGISMRSYCQKEVQLLNQAIYEEEINGNLDKAIDLYDRITQNQQASRAVKANALWHLGVSHEKLGLNKAIQYYQNLISNFNDQPEFRNKARSRLQKLLPRKEIKNPTIATNPIIEESRQQLKISKIFSIENFYGTISPNSQYLSYTNWDNGNLVVFDRYTHQAKELQTDASWNKNRWCDRSIWSPDNTQLAYCWISDNVDSQLRIYDMESESITILTPIQDNAIIWPFEWVENGQIILASLFDKTTRRMRIVKVSLKDKTIDLVKLMPKGEGCNTCGMAISEDGEDIIYGMKSKNGQTDLYLLSTDGKNDRVLISDPANKRIAKWLKDKTGFLYYSDQSGFNALWKAKLDKNLNIVSTEILLEGLTSESIPIGMTDDNIYYYLQSSYIGNIKMIDFDPDKGKFQNVVQIPSNNSQSRFNPFWSPDAAKIGYFRIDQQKRENYIEFKNLMTSKEHSLNIDSGPMQNFFAHRTNAYWLPDGNQLLMNYVHNDKVEIIVAEIETGSYDKISDGFNVKCNGLNGDIYYVTSDSVSQSIMKHNLKTKETNVLYSSETMNVYHVRLSPDGNSLAFIEGQLELTNKESVLKLLSTKTNEVSELWRSPTEDYFSDHTGLNWLHDSNRMIVSVSDDKNTRQNLFIFSIDSGEVKALGETIYGQSNFMHSIRIHPEGNKLIFGSIQSKMSIWAMENY